MKHIVLTGFMGVGKTTVGRELASRLAMKFLDMDQIIEKEEGRTVAQIFEERGEEYFRRKEDRVLKTLLDQGASQQLQPIVILLTLQSHFSYIHYTT